MGASGEPARLRVLHAPWPQEVIDALVTYQAAGEFHPYTCIVSHYEWTRVLVPTRKGWVCPSCGWRQSWVGTAAIEAGRSGGHNEAVG